MAPRKPANNNNSDNALAADAAASSTEAAQQPKAKRNTTAASKPNADDTLAASDAAGKDAGQPRLGLHNLRPAAGSRRERARVGRGRASGMGKTSRRGHNGEGQRSGQSSKRGFEGGQMPGYRQMPKMRPFANPNRKKWLEINVGQLAGLLKKGQTELTLDDLRERRLWKSGLDGVRILGKGEAPKGLTLHAHYVTPGAQEKLTAAGCTVVIAAA
jgi:large subunit ribosomal protein L15